MTSRTDGLRLREPVTSVERRDGSVVMRLAGELDLYNAPALRAALLDATEDDPRRVVVDLADVRFIDSTTLGVLVEARSRDRRRGVRCSPRPRSRRSARCRSPGSTASSRCATRSRPRSPPSRSGPEDEVDELYGLPLDEFTAARNALAKKLRADGERERADEVQALAKPSVAVWTVNQLARRRGAARREAARGRRVAAPCAGAGARGRRPGEAPGGGEEASASSSRELRRDARDLLTESGRPAGDALLERVAATLSSAAVDPEARPLLEAGRLTEEVEASGFDAFAGMALPAAGTKAKAAPAKAKPRRKSRRPPKRDAAGERRRAAEESRRAAALRRRASELDREARTAEREAARAAKEAERAARAATEAAESAASARAAADEARAEADGAT